MSRFFRPIFGDSDEGFKLAAAEGLYAYHTVKHNQSFRSMDCTSGLIKKLFDKQFSCARTKAEAICTNVFSPYLLSELQKDLNNCSFISVATDSSNHTSTKLLGLPVMVKFFDPKEGIKIRSIEFSNLPGETSIMVANYIVESLDKFNLKSKVVACGSDSMISMMGGFNQQGSNNVLKHLRSLISDDIMGIGCAAHIIHNASQTAVDQLPLDCEALIVKICKFFYIYTVRVERLKEFCEFVQVEYQQLLGYSSTRWLAMLPAVQRIIDIYPALKSFFLSQDRCPVVLTRFYNYAMSLL